MTDLLYETTLDRYLYNHECYSTKIGQVLDEHVFLFVNYHFIDAHAVGRAFLFRPMSLTGSPDDDDDDDDEAFAMYTPTTHRR